MTTEFTTQGGMHIESDPKTGAIAASNAAAVEEALKAPLPDDQPEQTVEAAAEEPKGPVDSRKAIMEKIYESREEQFKKELEYAADVSAQIDAGATVEQILEEKSEVPAEEKPVPQKRAAEQAPLQEALPQTRKVIVGNQQFDLTPEEMEQLAARTLQAEAAARQVYHQPQPVYYQPQQQVQQQPEPAREDLKDIARRITYGSEEESAKALADFANLTARMAQPQVAPEQIAQYAANMAIAQTNFNRNLETISSEYADIYQNRGKSLVAADHVGNLRQKYAMLGQQKPDLELWREACSKTRDEYGGSSETAERVNKEQTPAQQVTAVVNPTRLERKRAAPQPASAVNKTQPMQQQRIVTSSDIVSRMRQQRGQSVA